MSSLCTPCCMQYKLKNTYWQACRCSGNEQVSVVLQEPFDKSSSQTKAALAKRQIDKENPNCKTRSIAQNTQNCLCFICLFRFVCFVSFKIEIPHDCIPHSCNMTASKYWNVPITDCTHSNRTFHHFATTHTAEPRDLKYTNLQLTHASVSIRTFTNWLIDNHLIDDPIKQPSLPIIFFRKKKSIPTELTFLNFLQYIWVALKSILEV